MKPGGGDRSHGRVRVRLKTSSAASLTIKNCAEDAGLASRARLCHAGYGLFPAFLVLLGGALAHELPNAVIEARTVNFKQVGRFVCYALRILVISRLDPTAGLGICKKEIGISLVETPARSGSNQGFFDRCPLMHRSFDKLALCTSQSRKVHLGLDTLALKRQTIRMNRSEGLSLCVRAGQM